MYLVALKEKMNLPENACFAQEPIYEENIGLRFMLKPFSFKINIVAIANTV